MHECPKANWGQDFPSLRLTAFLAYGTMDAAYEAFCQGRSRGGGGFPAEMLKKCKMI